MLLRMAMTVRLVLPMATRRTTNGLIKGHSRQPGILQRGKTVFTGRVEPRGTRISSGCTSDTATRNTSRSDFEPFQENPRRSSAGFFLPGSRLQFGTRIPRIFPGSQNLIRSAKICAICGLLLIQCPVHCPVLASLVFLRFPVFGPCAGGVVLPVSTVRRLGG